MVGTGLCGGALLATFSVGGWLGTGWPAWSSSGCSGDGGRSSGWRWPARSWRAVIFVAVPVERLAGRLDPRQGTSLVRVQLWQAAVELVRQSPLLGIGLDNFLYRYPTVMPPDTSYEPNLSHPHNLILQFWLELGLLGAGGARLAALAVRPACGRGRDAWGTVAARRWSGRWRSARSAA